MSALPPDEYCARLRAKNLVVVAACAFAVGTGGYSTAEYFIARATETQTVIAEPVKVIARIPDADVSPQHTSDIRAIKEYLKPSVAELAKAFGVERQTIYDWQAGKGASTDRRAVLRELASACSKLAAMNVTAGSDVLRRKLSDGKSLIQMIATGTSATAAVAIIKTVLDTEDREKRLLSAHLGGQSHRAIDMSDAGKPHLSEEG